MAVSLVVIFVLLIMYGFVTGDDKGFKIEGVFRKILVVIIFIAVVLAVIWATGAKVEILDLLFRQEWSETFWTNVLLVLAVVGVLVLSLFSFTIAKRQDESPAKVIAEHLVIGLLVILITYVLGDLITSIFSI